MILLLINIVYNVYIMFKISRSLDILKNYFAAMVPCHVTFKNELAYEYIMLFWNKIKDNWYCII